MLVVFGGHFGKIFTFQFTRNIPQRPISWTFITYTLVSSRSIKGSVCVVVIETQWWYIWKSMHFRHVKDIQSTSFPLDWQHMYCIHSLSMVRESIRMFGKILSHPFLDDRSLGTGQRTQTIRYCWNSAFDWDLSGRYTCPCICCSISQREESKIYLHIFATKWMVKILSIAKKSLNTRVEMMVVMVELQFNQLLLRICMHNVAIIHTQTIQHERNTVGFNSPIASPTAWRT